MPGDGGLSCKKGVYSTDVMVGIASRSLANHYTIWNFDFSEAQYTTTFVGRTNRILA